MRTAICAACWRRPRLQAADRRPQKKADGWVLLFDGKTLDG